MAAVLSKALAGLGQGLSAYGQFSLQDRAIQAREERLMALRSSQEQSTYERNRADQLKDAEAARTAAGEAALQKSRYEQTKLAAEHTYQEQREAAKLKGEKEIKAMELSAKKEEKGGTIGGWKPDELERHVKGLVSTGMGLESDSIENFDKALQLDFSDKVARVVAEAKRNPNDSVSAAYNRVMKGEDVPSKPYPWQQSATPDQSPTPLSSVTRPTVTMPDANTPPVPGARRAPDGKWYVQKDGKYFMVNQ